MEKFWRRTKLLIKYKLNTRKKTKKQKQGEAKITCIDVKEESKTVYIEINSMNLKKENIL